MPDRLNEIWVICDQRDGRLQGASREIVSEAAKFAEAVTAFAWGDGADDIADELGALGAKRLVVIGDGGTPLTVRRIASAIGEQASSAGLPAALFAPMSYDGRDVCAHLSVMIDRPVIANVVGVERSNDGLQSVHEIAGGTLVARAEVTDGDGGIFLVREKSFVAAGGGTGAAEVRAIDAPAAGGADRVQVLARHVEQHAGPRLDDAQIVVSGGRGLGDPGRYQMIEELASLLGGAPAASRAIVDAGWVPYAYQVGQTGKTVKPEVYLAFGISGAMQHLVGMKGAKHIVAVNKDANAPIFQLADLGIVADVGVVLPALIESVRREREGG